MVRLRTWNNLSQIAFFAAIKPKAIKAETTLNLSDTANGLAVGAWNNSFRNWLLDRKLPLLTFIYSINSGNETSYGCTTLME
nr:MAG TPA: hypothetical protein [Caudoviricetes sp.]